MSDEPRDYEDLDPLSGAEDRLDAEDDAFVQFSDELIDSTGLGSRDPDAAKEARERHERHER